MQQQQQQSSSFVAAKRKSKPNEGQFVPNWSARIRRQPAWQHTIIIIIELLSTSCIFGFIRTGWIADIIVVFASSCRHWYMNCNDRGCYIARSPIMVSWSWSWVNNSERCELPRRSVSELEQRWRRLITNCTAPTPIELHCTACDGVIPGK